MTLLELPEPGSLSLTCDVFPYGSDTRVASGLVLTEATNRKGWYTTAISGFTGWHTAHVYLGSTIIDVAFIDVNSTGYIKANPVDFKTNWAVNSLTTFDQGSAGYTLASISGVQADIFNRIGVPVGANIAADILTVRQNTDYPDDCVLLDPTNGIAGTTVGVNGTVRAPSDTFANAATIATARGKKRIKFVPRTSVVLITGTYAGYEIDLNGGNFILNQNVALSGTTICSSSSYGSIDPDFERGQNTTDLDSGLSFENIRFPYNLRAASYCYLKNCMIGSTSSPFTFTIEGDNGTDPVYLQDCYTSKVSGLTFSCGGGADLILDGWYGDFTITNLAAGTTVVIYGYAKVTIAASCTGGTVRHTSHVEITNNGSATLDLVSEPQSWNTAWDAEVQSEVTDALNLYDGPTNQEMEIRTLPSGDYGRLDNQISILNRIGGFLGTTTNTIFGFLRSMMIEGSSITPSQVGGSYDNTQDSLEAIRNRGDAAWSESLALTASGVWSYTTRTLTSLGGTGQGVNYVYLTVDDSVTPLTDASVSVFSNGLFAGHNTTNISGVANLNLDNGNYTVAITLPAYNFTGGTLEVNGTTSKTFSMDQVVFSPATDPAKSNILITCYSYDTSLEEDVIIYVRQIGVLSGDTGNTFDGQAAQYTSDSNGQIVLTLWRNTAYEYKRAFGNWKSFTPNTDAYSIESIYGEL